MGPELIADSRISTARQGLCGPGLEKQSAGEFTPDPRGAYAMTL